MILHDVRQNEEEEPRKESGNIIGTLVARFFEREWMPQSQNNLGLLKSL